MFSGIIKKTGKIKRISFKSNKCVLEILSNLKFNKDEIGSSVSCSGVCLTLERYKNKILKFYLSRETWNSTNFKFLKIGDIINLEKSLIFGERVSGHFVQGHVDTSSKILKISYIGKSWFVNYKLKKKFMKYLVSKGSVAINGVSLTVSKIFKNGFQTVIIPHTLKSTNLIHLKEKDIVNVELDILAKYIKKNL